MRSIREKQLWLILRGSFDPRIFQPYWFKANNLLGDTEVEKAVVEVVHQTATVFRLDWCTLQVTPDQFTAITSDEGHEGAVLDLVVGAMRLLSQTPVVAVGVNRVVHFEIGDEEEWHKIGHKLVPKEEIWEPLLDKPGMSSVIVKGTRRDKQQGFVLVRVEPSQKYKFGVFVEVNDHFELRQSDGNPSNGGEAAKLLSERGRTSIENSDKIIEELLKTL